MNIIKNLQETTLNIALEGRLDTTTAPQLEDALKDGFDGVEMIVFDFAALEYISSAGLRVLLAAQKRLNGGKLVVRNVNSVISEVFDATGFSNILTIE